MQQLLELFLQNGLRPFQLDAELAAYEKIVTHSELITLLILELKGPRTMSDLAHDLGSPHSTLTSITNRLTRRGFVQRERLAKDRRVIEVQLTDAGGALARDIRQRIELMLLKVENALTPQELQQFITLAIKVAQAVQQPDVKKGQQDQPTQLRSIPIEE